jgi:DNA polymerase I-like protein with 3'-5' exonuclease and polymerase domains
MRSSWIDAADPQGYVHGKVITNGAITSRMTHHSPNMAQVPNMGAIYGKECRSCWVAPEGYVMVGIDASALELCMLAHYMRDADYVQAVVHGSKESKTDIHSVNQRAANLETRDQAKTFIYAFLYGAGPAKIGSIVGGGASEGQALIDSFLHKTPALAKLRKKVTKYAEKGWLPGLDGRRILVRSPHAALNTLLQGAGAIVMKEALALFYLSLNTYRLDYRFVANVHDEWQLYCKPEVPKVEEKPEPKEKSKPAAHAAKTAKSGHSK